VSRQLCLEGGFVLEGRELTTNQTEDSTHDLRHIRQELMLWRSRLMRCLLHP